MPHAVLRVANMVGIIVRDFYLSFPEDLNRRIMAMISSVGLRPQVSAGNHIKFEDYDQGMELHTLLNWIESTGWNLVQMSETAVSQYSSFATYVFKKQTILQQHHGKG